MSTGCFRHTLPSLVVLLPALCFTPFADFCANVCRKYLSHTPACANQLAWRYNNITNITAVARLSCRAVVLLSCAIVVSEMWLTSSPPADCACDTSQLHISIYGCAIYKCVCVRYVYVCSLYLPLCFLWYNARVSGINAEFYCPLPILPLHANSYAYFRTTFILFFSPTLTRIQP